MRVHLHHLHAVARGSVRDRCLHGERIDCSCAGHRDVGVPEPEAEREQRVATHLVVPAVPDQATLAELIPQLSFFETFALRQGTVLMPEVHESRLFNALKYLGLKSQYLHLDFSQKTKNWKPIIEKLLSHEKLNDAIVRWVVVPTKGGLIEWVSVRPLPVTPPSFSLVVLETKRDNAEWLPRPKTGPWTNSQTAWNELKSYSDRTDIEGIQLDKNGYIITYVISDEKINSYFMKNINTIGKYKLIPLYDVADSFSSYGKEIIISPEPHQEKVFIVDIDEVKMIMNKYL